MPAAKPKPFRVFDSEEEAEAQGGVITTKAAKKTPPWKGPNPRKRFKHEKVQGNGVSGCVTCLQVERYQTHVTVKRQD